MKKYKVGRARAQVNERKQRPPPPEGATTHHFAPLYSRALYFSFGVLLTLLMSGGILVHLLAPEPTPPPHERTFPALFVLAVACAAVWLIASSLRFRLTLTPHALTLRRAFTSRTMERRDMRGYKELTIKGDPVLYLFDHRQTRWPSMTIYGTFDDDIAVKAWFKGIPRIL